MAATAVSFILATSIFSPADQSGNEFGCQELWVFLGMFETDMHIAPIHLNNMYSVFTVWPRQCGSSTAMDSHRAIANVDGLAVC